MPGRARVKTSLPLAAEPGEELRVEDLVRDFYRLDSRQRRVLVIGSSVPRQVRSVGWADEWPALADYDVVIINLQTLDRITMVRLSRLDRERLTRMRAELYDLLLSGGEIYCILAPYTAFGSNLYFPDGSIEPEWSNLKWSPIGFSFTEISGETVQVEGDVKFDEYLRQVTGWQCYLNATASLNYVEERLREENKLGADDELFWQSQPLALNRYGKPLAASLCFGIRQAETSGERGSRIRLVSDALHLLPPPTKISVEHGIDLLVQEAKGIPARTISPDWSEIYHVPGQEQLEQKLAETRRKIQAAEREQKRLFQAYRDLQRTKSLLFEHGDNLKSVVADVCRRMGFGVKAYWPETRLLVLQTSQGRVLLDTGGRSGPAQPGDLQVLLQHAIFAQEDDGRIWKGVLVFNHYRLDDPSSARPAAFPAEVASKAREMRLGLITAEGLYAAFCSVMTGSMLKEELEERLHRTAGVISLPAIEPRAPRQIPGSALRLEIE